MTHVSDSMRCYYDFYNYFNYHHITIDIKYNEDIYSAVQLQTSNMG